MNSTAPDEDETALDVRGYEALVIAAHPDDAETQMGGTIAVLTAAGQRVLLVDLVDGEPAEYAERGVRAAQAQRAAALLGAERWGRAADPLPPRSPPA